MKIGLIVILLVVSKALFSQNDTTGVRNYFGVNINPVVGKLLGDESGKANRWGFTYRRCLGLYNLKIAVVGLNDVYPNYTGGNYSYSFDDTTHSKIRTTTANKSRDIRLGLERKWGSKHAKVFLGAGLTVGRFTMEERYTQYYYKMSHDSIGVYTENQFYDSDWGEDKSYYIKLGVDVWAGMAWDIGEHFNFMVQINPDLSHFQIIKNERTDPTSRFPEVNKGFPFASLASIDLMLGVRF